MLWGQNRPTQKKQRKNRNQKKDPADGSNEAARESKKKVYLILNCDREKLLRENENQGSDP
jgi:hypothetical protein